MGAEIVKDFGSFSSNIFHSKKTAHTCLMQTDLKGWIAQLLHWEGASTGTEICLKL